MTYQLKYGSFTFPKGFYPEAEDDSASAPSSKLPRADGAVQRLGYLDKRKVTVKGTIIHDVLSLGSFRTQLDAIRAGIRQGQQNLYIEHGQISPVSATRGGELRLRFYLQSHR